MKRRMVSILCALTLGVCVACPASAAQETVKIQQISAGTYHALAVDEGGNLWAWGWNTKVELADPTLDNSGGDRNGPFRSRPVKVMEGVTSASAGHLSSAAIRTDGSLWCWGGGNAPEKRLEGVKTVRLGLDMDSGGAVTQDGALWLWGESSLELLGLEPSDSPVQVLEDVKDVCLWSGGVFALKTDGTVVSVGADITQSEPLLEQVEQIAMGSECLMMLKTDGVLWGCYPYEQPELLVGHVTDMASGHGNQYALKTGGTLWGQGSNQFGQVGNGTPGVDQADFIPILDDVVQVTAGDSWAMALKADGTVWSWGYNGNGQLGIGGTGDGASIIGPIQSAPVQVDFGAATLQADEENVYPGVDFAVMVDGRWRHMSFYGLENQLGYRSYYVRLRDLAAALAETQAQFTLVYDEGSGAIQIVTGERYQAKAGDGDIPFVGMQAARSGTSRVLIDGVAVDLASLTLTDSAGGGHTYLKLRDLGRALNFNVRWDSEYQHEYLDVSGRILIETDTPYTEE